VGDCVVKRGHVNVVFGGVSIALDAREALLDLRHCSPSQKPRETKDVDCGWGLRAVPQPHQIAYEVHEVGEVKPLVTTSARNVTVNLCSVHPKELHVDVVHVKVTHGSSKLWWQHVFMTERTSSWRWPNRLFCPFCREAVVVVVAAAVVGHVLCARGGTQ